MYICVQMYIYIYVLFRRGGVKVEDCEVRI